MSLKSKVVFRSTLGLIVAAAILFIPAGSLKYWQGWALLALAFIPVLFFFPYLYKHDPQLLDRRMQGRENVREQKLIQVVGGLIFFPSSLLPGLDYRFGWSRTYLRPVPLWLTLLPLALVLGVLLYVAWVLKVNSFASRTIQVEAGQKVISTGPYRMVRHPMYSGSLVMWLFTPLALGSYFALPAFVLFIPFYVFRLLNEEKILRQELTGYPEYCLGTRFRLVPYVW